MCWGDLLILVAHTNSWHQHKLKQDVAVQKCELDSELTFSVSERLSVDHMSDCDTQQVSFSITQK